MSSAHHGSRHPPRRCLAASRDSRRMPSRGQRRKPLNTRTSSFMFGLFTRSLLILFSFRLMGLMFRLVSFHSWAIA
ncbi:hypothetical protein [Nostoc sp. PCC 9305]|uniref:hypothetical protein n=1 Tax=Nostoc sp. PCC 9305 TaxID=296636 RepID=UPI0039C73D1A